MTVHRPAPKSAPGGHYGVGGMSIGARKPCLRAGHAQGSFAPPTTVDDLAIHA